jgi:predicted membrane protein
MNSKKVFGSFLILIALILILSLLDVLDAGYIFSTYWPLIIIAIGAVQIFNKNIVGGSIVLLVGVWFLLDRFGLNTVDYIWPIILLVLGLGFIFGKGAKDNIDTITASSAASNSFTAFGGVKRMFEIDDYRGGRITTMFGGSEIDLTKCQITEKEINLEINTFFGGCELYVPANWKIRIGGFPVFGGTEEKGEKNTNEDSPVVNINAITAFGGFDIIYR